MQVGETSTPPSTRNFTGEYRGAGGKLRRDRKPPPSTPYDRPPPPSREGGWISRIVTPAKRLISGGATRFLPSFFSPLPSHSPNLDDGSTEEEREAVDHNARSSMDLHLPKSNGMTGSKEDKGKSKLHIYDQEEQKMGDHSVGQIPDIEQLIKGKTFSKEDINRLMEILQSRVVEPEQKSELPSMPTLEETVRIEKPQGKQIAMIDKEEEIDKVRRTNITPTRPIVQNDIGASPVDIARAYMGSRTAEVGFALAGSISNTEKFPLTSEFSTKSFMPSPLSQAPKYWPGAITQDQQDYSTPQTQKSRYGLQSFPRTPYSRAFTKSKSKLNPFRHDSERIPSVSSMSFKTAGTPVYGKPMTNMAEDSIGSGGPIRRTQNRLTSAAPARESTFSHTASRSPWAKEANFDSLFKKKYDAGTSSSPNVEALDSKLQKSEAGVSSVHPHSSKLARQILEQLDRPITLKEKSEELKLASSWKNSSQAAFTSSIQSNNNPVVTGVCSSTTMGMNAVFSAPRNERNNFLPERTDAKKGVTSASMTSLDKTSNSFGSNVGPSQNVLKLDSQTKNPDQGLNSNLPRGNGQSWFSGSNQSKGLDFSSSSKPEPQNAQRRPVLSSISIDKPGLKPPFTSETNVGFTFPVTTKSSTIVEPPTPSIVPSFSTTSSQEPKNLKIPASTSTFTFGNKITIAPPVAPSNAPPHNDAPVPKFKFGSGNPGLSFTLPGDEVASVPADATIPKYKVGSAEKRLNFGSIESDGICC